MLCKQNLLHTTATTTHPSMSSYKHAIRAQHTNGAPDAPRFRAEARTLQELFPAWPNDGTYSFVLVQAPHDTDRVADGWRTDLLVLLNEVNGDVQLAATKISDGLSPPSFPLLRCSLKAHPTYRHRRALGRGLAQKGQKGTCCRRAEQHQDLVGPLF